MQQSQKDAFDQLECFAKSLPNIYRDKEGVYPDQYLKERHCYLRALHNVDKRAAVKALKANIKHDKDIEPGKVRAIAKQYEEYGKVFHNCREH